MEEEEPLAVTLMSAEAVGGRRGTSRGEEGVKLELAVFSWAETVLEEIVSIWELELLRKSLRSEFCRELGVGPPVTSFFTENGSGVPVVTGRWRLRDWR